MVPKPAHEAQAAKRGQSPGGEGSGGARGGAKGSGVAGMGIRRVVSKMVEDGHRPPTLQTAMPEMAIRPYGHFRGGRPQGVKGRAWQARVKL
jgi:hypothetical protein